MRVKGVLWIVATCVLIGCATDYPLTQNEALYPDRTPKTVRAINDSNEDFHFVVLGDRTAGPRAGVFEQAVVQANWLNPAFVFGIGDLIEGHTEDRSEISRRWDHIEGALDACIAPFFYVVGNNDISNETMRDVWEERLGRRWYDVVYKNVLFIVLDTEDPPPSQAQRFALRIKYPEEYAAFMQAMGTGKEHVAELTRNNEIVRQIATAMHDADQVNISREQIDFVSASLRNNPDARHTFIFMHRPAWKYNSPEFELIEKLASERPHTFIAGHYHTYEHTQKDGTDYIQMGPTGGGVSGGNPAETSAIPDHVLMISMRNDQPVIANILLSGLADKRGFTQEPRPD